jgi:hypothetical protein
MSFSYARDEISSFVSALARPYLRCMKNRELEFKTKFWRNAAARLSPSTRARYLRDLQRAERVELGLARLVDAYRRVKNALGRRAFHTPRGAH